MISKTEFICKTYKYQTYKGLPMPEVLESLLDRLSVIGAVIAVAVLWGTLWNPWKDIALSVGLSVGWTVFIFLGPLVIVLILSLWWVHTH
jgi:hypothetical protein